MKQEYVSLVLAGMLSLGVAGGANATVANYIESIGYIATNLEDVGTGDLWQYTYTVSGSSFAPGAGFTIQFDTDLTLLTSYDSPTVPNGWSAYTFAGDVYDVQANEGNTGYVSLTEPLIVEFIWLGGAGTAPGSQPFYVYDEFKAVNDFGDTTAVPVPGAIWLLGAGLAAISSIGRRKRS